MISNQGKVVQDLTAGNFHASAPHLHLRVISAGYSHFHNLIILLDNSVSQGKIVLAPLTPHQKVMASTLETRDLNGMRSTLLRFTTHYNLWPRELAMAQKLLNVIPHQTRIFLGEFNQQAWFSGPLSLRRAQMLLFSWRNMHPRGPDRLYNALVEALDSYLERYGGAGGGLNIVVIGSGQDFTSNINPAAVSNMLFNARVHLFEIIWRNLWRCHGPGMGCFSYMQEKKKTVNFSGMTLNSSQPQKAFLMIPHRIGGAVFQLNGKASASRIRRTLAKLRGMINSGYELHLQLNHAPKGYVKWKLKLHNHNGISTSGMHVYYQEWLNRCGISQ